MQAVLADLALESEAATVPAMRLAQAADASPADERAQRFRRIATAIGKFWVCKRARQRVHRCTARRRAGAAYGALPAGVDRDAIIERALPVVSAAAGPAGRSSIKIDITRYIE
jgi:alkylation response protein AidB-like acyl-CoA dehydrogenase